jgi:hypothetical protein
MSDKALDFLVKRLKAGARAIKPLRAAWRTFLSGIDIDTYQGMMVLSILETEFKDLKQVPIFEKREHLWDECIAKQFGGDAKLTYIEFGVHQGYSIKHFAKKNQNQESIFIGLDSFEGLPEDWGPMAIGTFNTQGNVPATDDSRISFIKGWFQDTWDELFARLSKIDTLVVHFDADLYSSTLFALSKMDCLNRSYEVAPKKRIS